MYTGTSHNVLYISYILTIYLFQLGSRHFIFMHRTAPYQPVDQDGNPILKRSESPTGGSGGTIEKKKKIKPWPWNPKLGGCQMSVGELNIARAEAKGQLRKHIPDLVAKTMTFKKRSVHNPKEIICLRCKEASWEIIQGKHMETLHNDYVRRMNERKAAPRQKPVNLTDAQANALLQGQVIGTRAANQYQSDLSYNSNNHSRTTSFGSSNSAFSRKK